MSVLFSDRKFLPMFGTALLVVGFIFATLPASDLYAESLVEKAKKEGKVTFYSGLIIPDTQAVGDAFTKKYPFIKFEYYRGNQRKILQKVLMEKQGRKRVADVVHSAGALVNVYKKEGVPQKYVSPEAKNWPKGFQDPEGYWTTYYNTYHTFVYNTRMVAEKDVPKSYEDLLDPKWKGKIGIANEWEWFGGMLDLMGREKGLAFMKKLGAQELRHAGGRTLATQLMASGEFPMAKGVFHRALQMQKKGAPIQWTSFPTPTLAALRCAQLHADAPHPNAGKLFIDFLLSKEGQSILNKLDRHPVRKDIKVDPVVEKIRTNLLPIRPFFPEETNGFMKDYDSIIMRAGR
jgi:iron(III) transport system substrate-binding protein